VLAGVRREHLHDARMDRIEAACNSTNDRITPEAIMSRPPLVRSSPHSRSAFVVRPSWLSTRSSPFRSPPSTATSSAVAGMAMRSIA
jgi:hypothetical protein